MCVIREEEEEEEVLLAAYNKCQKVGKRTGLGKSCALYQYKMVVV